MKTEVKRFGVRCDCCRSWLMKKDHVTIRAFETKADAHIFMHQKGWNSLKGFDLCPKCYTELMKDDTNPPGLCTTECWDCSDLTCKSNLKRRIFSASETCKKSKKIVLEKICSRNPEQYWAYLNDKKIGYIRYEYGMLEVYNEDTEVRLLDLELFKDTESESYDSELPDQMREPILDMCKIYIYEHYNRRCGNDSNKGDKQDEKKAVSALKKKFGIQEVK